MFTWRFLVGNVRNVSSPCYALCSQQVDRSESQNTKGSYDFEPCWVIMMQS
jgi:hypothetical protein